MGGVEIKRPGREEWESGTAFLDGGVPIRDVVGSLVRYPTGGAYLTVKVVGLSEPDQDGTRHMQMEVYSPDTSEA